MRTACVVKQPHIRTRNDRQASVDSPTLELSAILAVIAGLISLGAGVRHYMHDGTVQVAPFAAGVLFIAAAFVARAEAAK